jgi:Rod binding domain-containing protein
LKIDFDPASLTLARETTSAGSSPVGSQKLTAAEERQVVEAKKAAQEFEAMFAELMLKSMRQTAMPEDASNALDIFQGMLDGEYAKAMTSKGELGVQDLVLDWMRQVDPKLGGALAGGALPPKNDAAAVNNALKNYRMQQYQMQATLPLSSPSFD